MSDDEADDFLADIDDADIEDWVSDEDLDFGDEIADEITEPTDKDEVLTEKDAPKTKVDEQKEQVKLEETKVVEQKEQVNKVEETKVVEKKEEVNKLEETKEGKLKVEKKNEPEETIDVVTPPTPEPTTKTSTVPLSAPEPTPPASLHGTGKETKQTEDKPEPAVLQKDMNTGKNKKGKSKGKSKQQVSTTAVSEPPKVNHEIDTSPKQTEPVPESSEHVVAFGNSPLKVDKPPESIVTQTNESIEEEVPPQKLETAISVASTASEKSDVLLSPARQELKAEIEEMEEIMEDNVNDERDEENEEEDWFAESETQGGWGFGWGAGKEKGSDAGSSRQAGGWGSIWGGGLNKFSNVVNSTLEHATRDLEKLQTKVTDLIAPENEDGTLSAEEAQRREEVLARLQAAGEDDAVDKQLKNIDERMEKMASSAFGALGAAWKGANKLASVAASEIKQGMEDVKDLHVMQVVAGGAKELGTKLATKGGSAIEGFSKTALGLLSAEPSGWDQDPAALDDLTPEEVTFDRCFYIYGGPEYLEELEVMGTEATARCNRARAQFAEEQKNAIETRLESLREVLEQENTQEEDQEPPQEDEQSAALVGALTQMLAENMRRAEGLKLAVSGSLNAGFQAIAEEEMEEEEMLEVCRSQLVTLRAEGVRGMSEMTTLSAAQLLQLASYHADTAATQEEQQEEQTGGFHLTLQSAHSIRLIMLHMVSSINNLQEVFTSALATAAATPEDSTATVKDLLKAEVENMQAELNNDGSEATRLIQNAMTHVLYILLNTTIDASLLPEEVVDASEEADEHSDDPEDTDKVSVE